MVLCWQSCHGLEPRARHPRFTWGRPPSERAGPTLPISCASGHSLMPRRRFRFCAPEAAARAPAQAAGCACVWLVNVGAVSAAVTVQGLGATTPAPASGLPSCSTLSVPPGNPRRGFPSGPHWVLLLHPRGRLTATVGATGCSVSPVVWTQFCGHGSSLTGLSARPTIGDSACPFWTCPLPPFWAPNAG